MEVLLCWLIGLLITIGVYLVLSRNLLRMLFGVMIIGTAANLLIFVLGRLTKFVPAFVAENVALQSKDYANALPQALILTAIVISFGVAAYAVVLITRAWLEMGTIDADEIREAEPKLSSQACGKHSWK